MRSVDRQAHTGRPAQSPRCVANGSNGWKTDIRCVDSRLAEPQLTDPIGGLSRCIQGEADEALGISLSLSLSAPVLISLLISATRQARYRASWTASLRSVSVEPSTP
jgi:hypothetical protein